jgi:hypothetical protein
MTLMTRPSRSSPSCVHHAVIDGSPIVTSSSAANQITLASGPLSRAGGVAIRRVRANMAALIVATEFDTITRGMPSGQVTSWGGLFNIFSGTSRSSFPLTPLPAGILVAAIVAPIKYQRRNNNSRGW